MLNTPTARIPYFHVSSGMFVKFIPYHPTSSVNGRKIVVTTVRMPMVRFGNIDLRLVHLAYLQDIFPQKRYMVAKPFHSVGKDRKAFLFLRLKEMVCIGAENIGHIGKLGQKRLEMEHVFAAARSITP